MSQKNLGTALEEKQIEYLKSALENSKQELKRTEQLLDHSLAGKNKEINVVESQYSSLEKIVKEKEEVIQFLQVRLTRQADEIALRNREIHALEEKLVKVEAQLQTHPSSDNGGSHRLLDLDQAEADLKSIREQVRAKETEERVKNCLLEQLRMEAEQLVREGQVRDNQLVELTARLGALERGGPIAHQQQEEPATEGVFF